MAGADEKRRGLWSQDGSDADVMLMTTAREQRRGVVLVDRRAAMKKLAGSDEKQIKLLFQDGIRLRMLTAVLHVTPAT